VSAQAFLLAKTEGYWFTLPDGQCVNYDNVVHRETRFTEDLGFFRPFREACALAREQERVVLGVDKAGRVCEVWTTDEVRPLAEQAINKWRGCYGKWPLKRLNS
jgi:ribosomal protein S16